MENDMTRITRPVLTEALIGSDELIPPKHMPAYQRARDEWEDIATTRSGEYAVISAAQAGEESAKLFLLYKLLTNGGLTKTFWRFAGSTPSAQRAFIAQGGSAIYRSIVTESLEQILRRWDLDHKAKAEAEGRGETYIPDYKAREEDYFTNFLHQVGLRTVTNTSKYNKELNRGGMGGKIMKGEAEPQIGSYEVYTGNKDHGEVESSHNAFRGSENLDAWQTFVDDPSLDNGTPSVRDVLKYFLKAGSFDAKAAGRKFGKTHQTIYTKLKSMKDILETHGIDQAAFENLLQIHGASSLADTL